MLRPIVLGVALASAAATVITSADGKHTRQQETATLVLGHRGASGYLPEHTLASYQLAIEQGANYIEPDLVATRDGVLIARHEVNITNTTNVATLPQYAGRRTTKTIDGITETGWFADDFTLAEIKTLRARQPVGGRPQQFNDLYQVPTFTEVLALAQRARREKGRVVGVYPETKHPTYHRQRGLALEPRLVQALQAAGWNRQYAPVFIQSFEVANLRQLNSMTPVRLVQLIDAYDTLPDGSIDVDRTRFREYDAPWDFTVAGDPRRYVDLVTAQGLAEIATYADGIGPWKRYIIGARVIDRNGDGQADDINGDGVINDADKEAVRTSVVDDAHEAGLFVHAYTFRNEATRLLTNYSGAPVQEYLDFYCLGVDGVFSDFPDTALTARLLFWHTPTACASFRP